MPVNAPSPSSSFAARRLDRRAFLGLAVAAAVHPARPGRADAAWPVAPAPPAGSAYEIARERLTRRAFAAAFSTEEDGWDPAAGLAANRTYLARLYGYYGALYLAEPERFLWAGFARLGGASVVGGLEALVRAPFPNYPDPSLLTTSLVATARAIFLDLGWQHEALLEDPGLAIALGREHDARSPAREPYAAAWEVIARGETGSRLSTVAGGNVRLLANEQFSIVQPFYDTIRADPEAGPVFRRVGGAARRIHPYHRDFAQVVPGGDLGDPDQRWAWIAEPGGMWEAWVALPPEERRRLVELSLEDLVAQRWGPVIEGSMIVG